MGGSDQLGHSDGFDRGRGRGRGGGMSRPPRDASDRGRGRGRGGGVGVPRRGRGDGDRGVRSGGSESERAGFGRIDTWTNSNVVETNGEFLAGSREKVIFNQFLFLVWDNSMAKFVAKPAASESNTWDNSMADSVLKKDSRADTSADDWTGEDTDWSVSEGLARGFVREIPSMSLSLCIVLKSSETRVFINQAAQKQQQLPVTVQPQSQSGAQQPSQTAPGSLTFGRSQQGSMELNNFSHAGSQQHFHGGHGEA